MKLNPEVEEAARILGKSLGDQEVTQHYLEARKRVEADAEVNALEKELYTTYENLIARQQAGQQIPRDEVEAFYALRNRVFAHPLVQERENALQPLKSLFSEVVVEISAPLGVDYSALIEK